MLPAFLPFLSKISTSCFIVPSNLQISLHLSGAIVPSSSDVATSYSMASSTNSASFSTSACTLLKVNFSLKTACFPALYFTEVYLYPFPYLNRMNGSCLPIKSASLRKLASTIVSSSLHFLFNGCASASLSTGTTSGSCQQYCH